MTKLEKEQIIKNLKIDIDFDSYNRENLLFLSKDCIEYLKAEYKVFLPNVYFYDGNHILARIEGDSNLSEKEKLEVKHIYSKAKDTFERIINEAVSNEQYDKIKYKNLSDHRKILKDCCRFLEDYLNGERFHNGHFIRRYESRHKVYKNTITWDSLKKEYIKCNNDNYKEAYIINAFENRYLSTLKVQRGNKKSKGIVVTKDANYDKVHQMVEDLMKMFKN